MSPLPGLLSTLGARLTRLPTFRALRHRSFRLYFLGQLISLTGTWLQTTALMWLAFRITGQSSWPAWVVAAQALPIVFLSAWGGSLSDRWPKRSLLLVTQVLLMLVALALAGVSYWLPASPWALVLMAGLAGLIHAVDWPARLAFVFEMVGREDLVNAVGLSSLLFNVARAVGPAIGGLLLAWAGPTACFLINGLSYLAVLAALAAMEPTGPVGPPGGRHKGSLGGGLKVLLGRRRLLVLILLTGAIAAFGWPAQALLPALSLRHPEGGSELYGWMLSAVGGGALVAALVVASVGFRPGGEGKTRPGAAALLGTGAALACGALLLLAWTQSLALALTACTLLGTGMILFLATSQALLQLSAEDHNRGAVMGIWSMVLGGARPVGHLLAGWAADLWSAPAVTAVLGLGIALAVAVALLALARVGLSRGEAPG